MIFGRKKQSDEPTGQLADDVRTQPDDPRLDDSRLDEAHLDEARVEDSQVADAQSQAAVAAPAAGSGDDTDEDLLDEQSADDGPVDETAEQDDPWAELDASRDWRYDGPFDISEVDLSADAEAGIERVDLGSLIVTPEEEVGVQLQLQQETGDVQALVAMHQNSGLEVALFAAPAKSSMIAEVREGLTEATLQSNGTIDLAEGPFGTEIRRLLPIEAPDGETYLHPSRIWMVQGPRWLLRGVLMGEAGMQDDLQGSAGVLLEFFRNIVVNRDTVARVPGDLVLLRLPEGVHIEEEGVPEEMPAEDPQQPGAFGQPTA